MNYDELADAAVYFLNGLSEFRLLATDIELHADKGCFRDIFRSSLKPRGGTYWFFRPDGRVFDIGKADLNIWARIFAQTGTAAWHGDPTADFAGTSGESWGFPKSQHLGGGAANSLTMECVREGTFHVGWIAFEPGHYSTLVEVYLQTLCKAVDGELPEFCKKIG